MNIWIIGIVCLTSRQSPVAITTIIISARGLSSESWDLRLRPPAASMARDLALMAHSLRGATPPMTIAQLRLSNCAKMTNVPMFLVSKGVATICCSYALFAQFVMATTVMATFIWIFSCVVCLGPRFVCSRMCSLVDKTTWTTLHYQIHWVPFWDCGHLQLQVVCFRCHHMTVNRDSQHLVGRSCPSVSFRKLTWQ